MHDSAVNIIRCFLFSKSFNLLKNCDNAMNNKLIVDRNEGLQEYRETGHQPQNTVVRIVAKIISYIFHPVFVPVYVAAFLVIVEPFFFSSSGTARKVLEIIRFFILYSFFPLVTVLLCKALGFLQSIHLKTQKERIIPYIACNVYYFFMAYVLRHQQEFAREVVQFAMAIFIACSAALIANIYMKISMHAISMGIMVMFIGILAPLQAANYTIYISVAVLIAGLVCTARLIVSDHTSKEVYAGLLLGACSQLVAIWADGILP
jgi:hypothetical protein